MFRVFILIWNMLCLTGCLESNDAPESYRLKSIHVTPISLMLEVGESEQIAASAVPATANALNFGWSSETPTVATVSNGLVTAVGVGNSTITANYEEVSATIPIEVKTAPERTYSDTIVRMTLRGTDCPFADHADYGVYIPTRTESLRGVMILQHGCGMEQFGITRPYDLQYQSFARKWKLAVIETALYGSCGLWRDPASGTANALFKVLNDTGDKTEHPELNNVPWLLFGHSAGGYWTLAMLKDYPERIMAAVCYSAAFGPQWDYPKSTAEIPVLMRHAGANDSDPGTLCWATAVQTFLKLRNMEAPVCIAYNAGQNHNFSYIRYMAIPFFEAVMKQRMPEGNTTVMHDIDRTQTWLGDTLSLQIFKESDYTDNKSGLCLLPDETTAKNWKEFVSTGTVADKTPPPAPFNVKVKWNNNALEIMWEADADIESGILRFNVYKDGVLAGKLPANDAFQKFDTNGDNSISVNVPDMKYRFAGAANTASKLSVSTVNHFNLESEKANIEYRP